LSHGKDHDWSEDCLSVFHHPDGDSWTSACFLFCCLHPALKAQLETDSLCIAPSTAPQATLFVRSCGHCIVVAGLLGVMSSVVARSLLDTIAMLKPKSTHEHVCWRRQHSVEKIDVMCQEWLICDRIKIAVCSVQRGFANLFPVQDSVMVAEMA
jgi:hypothetical protein